MADRWLNAAALAAHVESAAADGSSSSTSNPSVESVGGAVPVLRPSYSAPSLGHVLVPRFEFSKLRLQIDIQLQVISRRMSELEEYGEDSIGQPGVFNTFYHDLAGFKAALEGMNRTLNDLSDLHYKLLPE
eukprot:s123_g29.t1